MLHNQSVDLFLVQITKINRVHLTITLCKTSYFLFTQIVVKQIVELRYFDPEKVS